MMKPLDLQPVGDLLGTVPVGAFHQRIVDQLEVDLALVQHAGQPTMPVEVDLQPARQPGRHPHVAQPQVFVNEIEVVVQALAVVWKQVRLASVLVVPRLVGRARLHRRQDAYQPWLFAPLGQDLLDTIFLADVALAQKLDLNPVLHR